MAKIAFKLLPIAGFPPTYKYPFFLLDPAMFRVSLSSIVDFETCPPSSIPPMLLESFLGKRERRSRSIFVRGTLWI
jgi:hypothetical protein